MGIFKFNVPSEFHFFLWKDGGGKKSSGEKNCLFISPELYISVWDSFLYQSHFCLLQNILPVFRLNWRQLHCVFGQGNGSKTLVQILSFSGKNTLYHIIRGNSKNLVASSKLTKFVERYGLS